MYVELGRYDEAVHAFKQAIAMRPTFAVSHLGLGRCYHRLRRNSDAELVMLTFA
jgi:Flp pilus assembly protein TadD